jgi:uncharacterized membrane protein YqaE (UPF0057 family)
VLGPYLSVLVNKDFVGANQWIRIVLTLLTDMPASLQGNKSSPSGALEIFF